MGRMKPGSPQNNDFSGKGLRPSPPDCRTSSHFAKRQKYFIVGLKILRKKGLLLLYYNTKKGKNRKAVGSLQLTPSILLNSFKTHVPNLFRSFSQSNLINH